MKKGKLEKQKRVIENMRERLNREILNEADKKKILKISQELDELIADYYRFIKEEEAL